MERWYKIVDIAFNEKQQADLESAELQNVILWFKDRTFTPEESWNYRIKLYYCQWSRKWRKQKEIQHFSKSNISLFAPEPADFCLATFSKLAWLNTSPVAFCSLSQPSQLAGTECRFHFQNNRTRPAELQIITSLPTALPHFLRRSQPAADKIWF